MNRLLDFMRATRYWIAMRRPMGLCAAGYGNAQPGGEAAGGATARKGGGL